MMQHIDVTPVFISNRFIETCTVSKLSFYSKYLNLYLLQSKYSINVDQVSEYRDQRENSYCEFYKHTVKDDFYIVNSLTFINVYIEN